MLHMAHGPIGRSFHAEHAPLLRRHQTSAILPAMTEARQFSAHLLPADLAAAIARAGVDPTAESRALRDALKRAIADRRGYCFWDVDHIGWRVDLLSPEEESFHGGTLEEALAWCLVWLMTEEIGVGPFA